MHALTEPIRTVVMGEYGTDPDEIASAILTAYLARQGLLDPLAFIGNHAHALKRSQNIKFVLNSLGLPHVPVGMGEHGFGASSKEYETDPRFLAPVSQLQRGRETLRWTLEHAEDSSVVLVLNSGFTDAVWLWMDQPSLFLRKVREVVIMGGVEVDGDEPALTSEGFMIPSIGPKGAANNNFDPGATQHLYDLVQRHGIPSVITTRHAAGACKLPFGFYKAIAATGNPVGVRLNEKQAQAIRSLWQRANEPADTPLRGELPLRCDRNWFIGFFCGGNDPGIGAGNGADTRDGDPDDIVPHMASVALYDALNLVFAIPSLREQHGDPTYVEVKGARHALYGISPELPGIRGGDSLRDFMQSGMVDALRLGSTSFANPAMAAN